MKTIRKRGSGRVCLLGDNTDLIGRSAIAAAISAETTCTLTERADAIIQLHSNELGITERGSLDALPPLDSPLRYVWAVVRRLRHRFDCGFDISISSDVPIGAGMSSSTALCIAAIRTLYGALNERRNPEEIAELAYQTESVDLRTECGRMDQYAIAVGGVTWIETGDNPSAEKLPIKAFPIVVADTQEQHDTATLQVWLRARIRDEDPELMDALGKVVSFVARGRESLLTGDISGLGELMTLQQAEERRMGTSTDRLDLFCRTATEAGAYGAKQMGAGGGGCMIAVAPPEVIPRVARALELLGAPTWRFDITSETSES